MDGGEEVPFDANLAEYIDDSELMGVASGLIAGIEEDKSSRKDWEETYSNGIKLLGFKNEERSQPFEGSSGVHHPLLAESITQFQAQAYKELLPASGPVKAQVLGEGIDIKKHGFKVEIKSQEVEKLKFWVIKKQ